MTKSGNVVRTRRIESTQIPLAWRTLMKAPFLLGRLIFGGFFIYNGIHHLAEREKLSQYTAAKNIPMPDVAVTASGVALLLGGTSILLGIKPKYGAATIAGFLLGVSPLMHDFWKVEDPNQRMQETINFMKNMALLGGALALTGIEEPWPTSVPVGQPKQMDRLKRFVRSVKAA
jgi:putative oxidoreductase